MKTSVVIPTFNHWHLTFQLIRDLFYNATYPDEVLVINNGSTERRDGYGYPVREINLLENVGFVVAANTGMLQASGDLLFLISNDVRIHKDIIADAKKVFENTDKVIMTGKVYWGNTGWNTFGDKTFPYAEGWLLSCLKKSWAEIGGFDPRYSPYDFEDIDFSTEALARNYALMPFADGAVEHLVAGTIGYNPERERITIEHQEMFRKKWLP